MSAVEPDRSVTFDRVADSYDATRGFPPGVERSVAELFANGGNLLPGSRVLEIGVGTGRIALPLAAHVARYFGVDLSAAMLAQLVAKRGSLPVSLARASAARLPFASATFDAAIGVHVFHLIPAWREVMGELARVLRPEGVLLHGGDDHSEAPAWWTGWRRRVEGYAGGEDVGVPHAELRTFPEALGWGLAGVHRIAFMRRMRPRALVDLIASRSWSATWRLSDEALAETVEAVRADLTAAVGDLDRELDLEQAFWLRAYHPPRS
jgi:SAM-dependent methyltransferase